MKYMTIALGVILSTLTINASANYLRWVSANPATTCSEICHGSAVSAGPDRHGYQFYVCRGRVNNEWRPGFNINTSPDSANKCLFEIGGGRGESGQYQCLCH
ncbi:MAG: hypothetical protein R3F02_01140 [Thiolinea sp.]